MRTTADNWDHFWSQEGEGTGQVSHSKQRILAVLDRYVKPDMVVLDAGCGSGFFSKYFISKGANVFSLDFSDSALEKTRKAVNGRAAIIKANLLESNLSEIVKDRSIDLVFTDGLFEHFDHGQQDKILRNFKSVLAYPGLVVTFVPNLLSPWQIIRPFYMPGISEQPFIFQGLLSLNKRNSLRVIEAGGINTIPARCSPDRVLGKFFGMLVYSVSAPQDNDRTS